MNFRAYKLLVKGPLSKVRCTKAELAVLGYLSNNANGERVCSTSVENISEFLGMATAHVRWALRSLVHRKFVGYNDDGPQPPLAKKPART